MKKLINASDSSEIIFTNNTTDSINKIVFGYYQYQLKPDDEVIITLTEHASNILPWFELQDKIGIKIKYIPLTENHEVTLNNLKKVITDKTKVVSIALMSNVIGDIRPVEEIGNYLKDKDIDFMVDAAQAIAHQKIDVKKYFIDFMAFSAHKMYGPTGVGVLYGRKDLLNMCKPIIFGGGMNASFKSDGFRIYNEIPSLLEAGTPNIAGVIGFKAILEYLDKLDIEKIQKYEQDLKNYALEKLKEIDNITIYNEQSKGPIITFNYQGIFAQDLAIYLNKHHICVRAGNHCAKIVKDIINVKNTVRISFGLYNTKEEINDLIKALKNEKIKEEII